MTAHNIAVLLTSRCLGLQVCGEFLRDNEKLPCTMTGTWDKELSVVMPNGSKRRVWQIAEMPEAESRSDMAHMDYDTSLLLPGRQTHLLLHCEPASAYAFPFTSLNKNTKSCTALCQCAWISNQPSLHAIWPYRYNMTKFAVALNELPPGLEQQLPPTDSRLRPDQHALEQGVFDQVHNMQFVACLQFLKLSLNVCIH